jgi:PKD domain
MRRRPALILGSTVLTALVLAAPARADFCVGPPPCLASLQAAFDAAETAPGADTITVAPGTFAGGATDATNPVSVVGAGATQTTVTRSGPGHVLALDDPASSVTSLHISVDEGLEAGLRIAGVASDLLIDGPAGVVLRRGVDMTGTSRLENTTISFPFDPGGQGDEGLRAEDAGSKTLTGVTISSEQGIQASNTSALTIASSRFTAERGIDLVNATAVLDDVLFVIASSDSTPARAVTAADTDTTEATLRNVTAWGAGTGLGVETDDGGKAHLVSAVVRNFATDLQRQAMGGSIDARFSAYASTAGGVTDAGGNIVGTGDLGFLDLAGGDFRLPYNSVLVDNGDPGPVLGPPTDLAGGQRLVNGIVDIGAFEYQRRPPVPAISVSAGEPRVDDVVGFDAGGSTDADPGDTPLSFLWTFDDGETARGTAVLHAFRTAGSHRVTLTVTDPAGASASLSRIVVISSKGGGGVLPPVPSLSSFTNANSSFAVRSLPRAAGRKRPRPKRGTTFRYTLSAAAKSVKVSFDALVPGKRSGRSCVKPTKRLKRARSCTRTVAKGGIAGPAAAGRNSLAWDGRIKRKALASGRYKATARATDRFGRLSNARTLTFTIVASR